LLIRLKNISLLYLNSNFKPKFKIFRNKKFNLIKSQSIKKYVIYVCECDYESGITLSVEN